MIILWDADPAAFERYRLALGADAHQLTSAALVARALHDNHEVSQIVIGPDIELEQATALADSTRLERPHVGVILLRHRLDVAAMTLALRSGVREVVTSDDHTAIADAVRRSRELTSRLIGTAAGGTNTFEGKVVTVFSAKGGVGKTTLSTNLGTYLASCGHRTLLVDLDLSFGDVAISLQLMPTASVIDAVAMSGHLDEQGLEDLVTTHRESGLDVIAAPSDPGDADRIPPGVVSELLKVARAHYDYVIVDTPPAFTEHVLAACDLSNLIVLIATLDIPALKNIKVAINTLDQLGSPKDDRIIVLNRADAKVGLREEDVVASLHAKLAASIPSSLNVPASTNRGVAIILDEPRHPVSLALKELADTHVRARFGTVGEAPTVIRRRRFGARR